MQVERYSPRMPKQIPDCTKLSASEPDFFVGRAYYCSNTDTKFPLALGTAEMT